MAYLRGQSAFVIQTVKDYVFGSLEDLDWMQADPDDLPFGATRPVSVIEYVPAPTGEPVAVNTVAFTSGEESDDDEGELGCASGGLWEVEYVLFFDVYGESQGVALRIANDIKGVLTGKLPGTRRMIPLTNYLEDPTEDAEGHSLEFTRVERNRPENFDVKRNWQIVKATVIHSFNAAEGG